jgi:uncharacterized membrane protein YhaH (DUF805 family)
MTAMEWMVLPYKRYADFSGRSRRLEYWLFTLFYVLVIAALIILAVALEPSWQTGEASGDGLGAASMAILILLGVFVVGSIIPGIAVTVRRFHDQDKSGWMYLLSFIPYVGGLILLVFMCIEGTRGDNSYGPDPKGGFDASVFA